MGPQDFRGAKMTGLEYGARPVVNVTYILNTKQASACGSTKCYLSVSHYIQTGVGSTKL